MIDRESGPFFVYKATTNFNQSPLSKLQPGKQIPLSSIAQCRQDGF